MIEDASSSAESDRLRLVSNWWVELKNPGAIKLQSSSGGPIPFLSQLLPASKTDRATDWDGENAVAAPMSAIADPGLASSFTLEHQHLQAIASVARRFADPAERTRGVCGRIRIRQLLGLNDSTGPIRSRSPGRTVMQSLPNIRGSALSILRSSNRHQRKLVDSVPA